MAIKGKKLNSDLVMFGEPLNEKAKNALERSSPTANQIIQSLPPSAFIPMPEPTKAEVEKEKELSKKEKEQQKVLSAEETKRDRLQKKKEAALKKREERKKKRVEVTKTVVKEENIKEDIIINKVIKKPIEPTKTLPTPDVEQKSMNLEDELKALESNIKPKETEAVREEVVYEEPTPQADLKDQILDLLEGEENAPSLDLIKAWKDTYGKNGIHVMAFGEGDVYVYHHLTRGEWKKIKELMQKMRESENPEEVEEKLKEKVVLYCVLWPSVDERWLDYCKAGILDSLYQMILLNSGFLTPQQAMLLTTQL
jgi:hypothetical protein